MKQQGQLVRHSPVTEFSGQVFWSRQVERASDGNSSLDHGQGFDRRFKE